MNKKKSDDIINYFKEFSEGLTNSKTKEDNKYIQSYKKVDHKAFFVKKPKNNLYTNKIKKNIENSNSKKQTLDKNDKVNNETNEIKKTPENRKNSNNSSSKNEKEEDLVTSFEKKPSELKSPETISESSFTSSFEKNEKEENKNENNEIVYIDKTKESIDDKKEDHKHEKEKLNNIENKTKKIKPIEKTKFESCKNNNKKPNLKITVNKTPRENLKYKEEKSPYVPINQRKNKEKIKINDNDNELNEKNITNEKLLTDVKNIKHKKFIIKTEDKRNNNKKRYIININKTTLNTSNNKKAIINENKNINNKMKSRNNIDEENKKKVNKNNIIYSQKKKNVILYKTSNNKLNLDFKDSNYNNIDLNKNQNITTLSRNISFHNPKQIIYAPKKLITSSNVKSPQKSEILAYKNMLIESSNSLNNNINNTKIKNEEKNVKNNPEQIRKKFIELNGNNFNDDGNNNNITLNNSLKNVNNFFKDNQINTDYSQNPLNLRYSVNESNHNSINNNMNNDSMTNEQTKNAKNIDLILNNKLLTPNHNLSNSSGNINNINNFNLQNLFQYNFNSNYNSINNEVNNNNSLISNSLSINFEDLIILQKYLHEMIFSLSSHKPIHNECFEFWNYYYNSSLLLQLEKVFKNQSDSSEVKISIYYSLMSIMLCYDYSFEHELFNKVIIPLSDILKMNYKNLILICEYILKKISKNCIKNIWVLKLASIVNESNLNDYTSQLLKGYNFTLVERIAYNTNIILQNLRYLLKNFKSSKNGILTSMFKKIREKTYEEINIFFRENILHVSNLNGSILGSIFLLKNTNFHPLPYPYVRTLNNKKYSLVLDLDETLIHFKPQNNGEDGGTLRVRPGIYEFLDEVGKYYELIVFTTATQDYADVLIDAVEEDKIYFEHRLYREHATIIDNDFVKDLTRIGRPLDKIIIVDNMPQNFRLQKENGIIIKAFWGEDKNDRALYELTSILVNIAKEGNDLRKGLVKYKDDIVKKVTSCFSKDY